MTSTCESFDLFQPQYPRRETQEAENHRAMSALYELIENAVAAAENYVMYTEGRLPPLAARGSDLVAAAVELRERYRHEAPCGWTEEKAMAHCAQRLTRAEIAALLSRPPLDVAGVRAILRAFADSTAELPRGRFLLMRDNLSTLAPHQPPDMARDLQDVCGALYDIQHVDLMAALREELRELDGPRDAAVAAVEDALAAFSRAVDGGDVVDVERAHRRLITARYELAVVCARRMQRVLGDDLAAQEGTFAGEMDALQRDAEAAVRQFKENVADRRRAIREDVGACERQRLGEDEANTRAVEAHRAAEKTADAELQRLVACKRQVIEELRQKARELRELMQQQREAVEAQIRAKRAEEERQTAYNEFANLQDQMKRRLLRCLEYCDRVESVAPDLQQYVDEMVVRMPRQSLRTALDAISDAEAGEMYDVYSAFVACVEELAVKKFHRLDTLERQARLVEHNRDSAMESLDPNMSHYRTDLEELLEQMKGVTGVINALSATQTAGEQLFQSVETGVRAKFEREGKVFVHPMQEFGIRSVEERSRFIDRSMQYVEGEERNVVEKKNVINRMRRAVEEEEAATETILRSRPAAELQ